VTGRRPRLLVLTPDLLPARGGIQLLVSRIVERLRAFEVRVVTRDTDGARHFDRERGWPVIRTFAPGGGPKADIAAMNAVAALQLRRFRPDVVLAGHLIAAPPTWAARVPLVVYLHADEIPAHPRLSRVSLRRASYAIAVSRHTAALAIRHGADPARVRLIPPGVDVAPAARRRSDRPTIVTVARLEDRYKGHDVVMRSLALVRRQIPAVRWVIVGDGSLRGELERLAERLGVRDAVVFAGAVDDAQRDEWLARSDVFAMPSRVPPSGGGEGFGIVFLEAGARGLPVVAANVGGSVDAVDDGRTGLLVDPEDERAIATALTELLLDPGRARAMGSAGAERAGAHGWDRAAERVETLLLAAAGRLPLPELTP
jgi:phosphatidylinositol alpha-1,6-mannosyltransferase